MVHPSSSIVIPAKAGIQGFSAVPPVTLDPGVRRDDGVFGVGE